MSMKHPAARSPRLGVELLEAREVPSAAFTGPGGLSIAYGDVVTTTGTEEYITATGPGVPGVVRVFDQTGRQLFSFRPFGNFDGGIYVAAGNVIRPDANINPILPDPIEIVVSTAAGSTGRVRVYTFANGTLQPVADFVPFGPNYTGGVQLAVGNVTGDNSDPTARKAEIVVGQQTGGSRVKVYSIDTTNVTPEVFLLREFNAYGPRYRGGITLDCANIHTIPDVPTDPYSYDYQEVITGKASSLPHVKVFDVQTTNIVTLASYMAFDTNFAVNRRGINVYAASTDGIRGAEIYVNPVGTASVRILDGWTSTTIGDFTVANPPGIRNIYLTFGAVTDPLAGDTGIRDLIAVYSIGQYAQIPIIFPGALNSPAGLNGSFPAG